jgi:hypothetical protein
MRWLAGKQRYGAPDLARKHIQFDLGFPQPLSLTQVNEKIEI